MALASQPTAARSDATLSQVESGPPSVDPSVDLSQYYADAAQIPAEVADEIALATRLGLVVNYPNVALLNPNQPMSRASTAALIHQTLVYQDRLDPLPKTSTTSPYLVEPETMTPKLGELPPTQTPELFPLLWRAGVVPRLYSPPAVGNIPLSGKPPDQSEYCS
ncbi:MAG: hypothetical protein HC922_00830 [Leptolyngbyaceae cyanobacterium SM2_3_12]|nr:hypothetical protein [Leptolyngbyaceae cyanobacterium SM2_3_12]